VLYLIRHCATTGQAPDAPLTDDGSRDAEALADRLAAELAGVGRVRLVSSPYRRALDSIRPLAQRLGLDVQSDDRLRERVLAATPQPGRPAEEWRARLRATFDDLDLRFDGGESSREAMARGVAALEDALALGADATVVMTHGNLLTLLLRHFDGHSGFETWQALKNPDVFRR
jgi:2,3-bisphosphoglycerate-dependent phosphoglycerate mutase